MRPQVHVIGAGPAGLMAAEVLAKGGARVVVHDRMPSPARKLLMAGKSGLNLTHSEPSEAFVQRYGASAGQVGAWLEALPPSALIDWVEGLGQPTFVGSSGRVFPRVMKASPLLRAWLARLDGLGVELRTRSSWRGWADAGLRFETSDGEQVEAADAVVLAMGGASWPRLGSDGGWRTLLDARGVAVAPFAPSNVGVTIDWSPEVRDRFAGQPLKGVRLTSDQVSAAGEVVITRHGLEGGPSYALSPAVRAALRSQPAELILDLKPDLTVDALATRLGRANPKDSVSNRLRKAAGLSPVAVAVLREAGPPPRQPGALASAIKQVRLPVAGLQGLERAISSAGGVRLDEVDERLMLRRLPGVFVAGEMLDWEAPTGGYLLQAVFASGFVAGRGALDWLASQSRARARP